MTDILEVLLHDDDWKIQSMRVEMRIEALSNRSCATRGLGGPGYHH